MTNKELVLLTVFVETGQRRWFVAGIKQSGELVPLMCSEPGNLDPYLEVEFDTVFAVFCSGAATVYGVDN
jgi:hypothetical protein